MAASPLVPGFSFIPAPYCYRCELGLSYPTCELACAKALEQKLQAEGPDTVAAFIGGIGLSAFALRRRTAT